jgi:hypothetical protein
MKFKSSEGKHGEKNWSGCFAGGGGRGAEGVLKTECEGIRIDVNGLEREFRHMARRKGDAAHCF